VPLETGGGGGEQSYIRTYCHIGSSVPWRRSWWWREGGTLLATEAAAAEEDDDDEEEEEQQQQHASVCKQTRRSPNAVARHRLK